MRSSRFLASGALAVACLLQASCVNLVQRAEVVEIKPDRTSQVAIHNPIRVHLNNGETVVFEHDTVIFADSIRSVRPGQVYGVSGSQTPIRSVQSVHLNDVAAVESVRLKILAAESFVATALATPLGVAAGVGLYLAVFGSCPTVYSDVDGVEVLESEMFPNSIAPLFEVRDVDRLSILPDSTGRLRLSVRNEALETHYINHVELIEVAVHEGAVIVPDGDGQPLALRDFVSTGPMTDRRGNDVTTVLAASDSSHYETSQLTIDEADSTDLWDYVDFAVSTDQLAGDSAYVYLQLRNSLLGTVYFYDSILKHQGPQAVKWLADDLENIGEALRLADFFVRQMGLRIDVERDGTFEQVAAVREVGPIAMDHVAVPIPAPEGDSLRIRLRFVADGWRIDRVQVAASASRPTVRAIPVSRVTAQAPSDWAAMVLDGIATPDQDYAVTGPGQSFDIEFDAGIENGTDRSYLLAMQGYYVEWMRGEWLRDNPVAQRFVPTGASVEHTLRRWSETRDEFETQFFSSKIPMSAQPATENASQRQQPPHP